MKAVSLSDAAMLAVVSAERQRAAGQPTLAVGERVEAVVLAAREKGFLLLEIGGDRLTAQTAQPLAPGVRFAARVVQSAPRLVLQILTEDPTGGQGGAVDHLRLFRSRPGLLEDMFRSLSDLAKSPGEHSSRVTATLGRLRGLLPSLIFAGDEEPSPGTGGGSASPPGGTEAGEGNGAARYAGGESAGRPVRGALPEALLRLAAAAEGELSLLETDSPERPALERLAAAARSALEALDVLKDVNSLSRQAGGPSVIPLPAAFPGGLRVQDLFIQPGEGQDGEEGGEASFRMVLCLNMETLGDILVDARLAGRRVTGTLRCGSEEVREYLQAAAAELEERLAAAGLPGAAVAILADPDIAGTLRERRLEFPLFQRDAVNLYA